MVDNLNIFEQIIYSLTIQSLNNVYDNFDKLRLEDRAQYAKLVIDMGDALENDWPNVWNIFNNMGLDVRRCGKYLLTKAVFQGIKTLDENDLR